MRRAKEHQHRDARSCHVTSVPVLPWRAGLPFPRCQPLDCVPASWLASDPFLRLLVVLHEPAVGRLLRTSGSPIRPGGSEPASEKPGPTKPCFLRFFPAAGAPAPRSPSPLQRHACRHSLCDVPWRPRRKTPLCPDSVPFGDTLCSLTSQPQRSPRRPRARWQEIFPWWLRPVTFSPAIASPWQDGSAPVRPCFFLPAHDRSRAISLENPSRLPDRPVPCR